MQTKKLIIALAILLPLLLLSTLIFLLRDNFTNPKTLYQQFNFDNGYSLLIDEDKDHVLYVTVYKDNKLIKPAPDYKETRSCAMAGGFGMKQLQTKDSRYLCLVNKINTQFIELIFDCQEQKLWLNSHTPITQFYKLRKLIEKDLPQTSWITQGMRNLKTRTNNDSYFVIFPQQQGHPEQTDIFIQFSYDNKNSAVIFEFPLLSYSLDGKTRDIEKFEYTAALPELSDRYTKYVLLEPETQQKVEKILKKYNLDFNKFNHVLYDADSTIAGAITGISGNLTLSEEKTLDFIYDIIEQAYGITEYWPLIDWN